MNRAATAPSPIRRLVELTGLILLLGSIAAPSAMAGAATRYAAPDGDGTQCSLQTPCAIETAVDDAPDGALVSPLPGDYGVASLTIERAVDLVPEAPGAAVNFSVSSDPGILVTDPGSSVSGIEISGPSPIEVRDGAVAERVQAISTGSVGCTVHDALIRDSICRGLGDAGLITISSGSDVERTIVRNVTAVGAYGMRMTAAANSDLEVDARNSIFVGESVSDVALQRLDSASLAADIDFSNFDTVTTAGGVPEPDPRNNQTQKPLFRDLADGDLRQGRDSPTIDAGTTAAVALGELDFEGEVRVQGEEIDIGADESEFADAAPKVEIVRKPKKRTTNTRPGFRFRGSDDATSQEDLRYLCGLDTPRLTRCSSPRIYRNVDPGRHRFRVVAVDGAGNQSRPASYSWRILKR